MYAQCLRAGSVHVPHITKVVGIFNRHATALSETVNFKQLGLEGAVQVRDIWRARDLGTMQTDYTVVVPPHGVVLLRVK